MSIFIEKKKFYFIVGPCALESLYQLTPLVDLTKKWGIQYVRAALFKPRTHPDTFQGVGEGGLPLIDYLKNQKLQLVTEACSKEQLNMVLPFASIIQVGARNMQNFEFLKTIGMELKKLSPEKVPHIMLKRGFNANFREWMSSALYLERYGVPKQKIILCERGSRNFMAPNHITLDLVLALKAKEESPYQVIIDPSHGIGEAKFILPIMKAIINLPLDGIMVEAHPFPKESISDAHQAISLRDLDLFFQEYYHLLK